MTAFGNRFPAAWTQAPETARVRRALADHLDGVRLQIGKVNWSYLAALGLRDRPPTDDGEMISTR